MQHTDARVRPCLAGDTRGPESDDALSDRLVEDRKVRTGKGLSIVDDPEHHEAREIPVVPKTLLPFTQLQQMRDRRLHPPGAALD